MPVLTGIGHQKNETLTDLMAHTALKTPTKAAEFIISHNKAFEDRMRDLQHTIVIKSQQLFAYHNQLLTQLNSVLVNRSRDVIFRNRDMLVNQNQLLINGTRTLLFHHRSSLVTISTQLLTQPRIILSRRNGDMEQIQSKLKSVKNQYIKNQTGQLAHFVSLIRLMAPDNILKKGFAIVKAGNRIISHADDIHPGAELNIILAETNITSIVTKKEKYDGKDFNL